MRRVSVFLALAVLLALSAAVVLASPGGSTAPRAVSALGLVPGRALAVHIVAEVPAGAAPEHVAREHLAAYGARPWAPAYQNGYSLTGLVWDSASLDQNYNAANEPSTLNSGGLFLLLDTHDTWNGVAGSAYAISYGGDTGRCPSLVLECQGPQRLDGNNDVAWLALRPGVLGVTWFTTQNPDEADMALSTRYPWYSDGADFDAQSTLLHEGGHVAGLGHSDEFYAVMWPYYEGERRILYYVDEDGITNLYPASVADPSPTPEPSPTAEPTPEPTPEPDPGPNGGFCDKHPDHKKCKP